MRTTMYKIGVKQRGNIFWLHRPVCDATLRCHNFNESLKPQCPTCSISNNGYIDRAFNSFLCNKSRNLVCTN
jgi:hypothetical protein